MRWTRQGVDFEDSLNSAIWAGSSGRQRKLQRPKRGLDGDVGGMQGLVGEDPLPWVPDIVGRSWREPGAVLIFGASYADFFSEFAGRAARMQKTYRASTPWAAFQAQFLSHVVDDDSHYYDPIQHLLRDANVSLESVLLSDLCRASFVEIQNGVASASEAVLRDNDQLFAKYVQANVEWHRERLAGFGGRVVVALGALATRGVLHLLGQPPAGSSWVRNGSAPWLSEVTYEGKRLEILRVPHPAAYGQAPRDRAADLRALLDGQPVANPRALRRVVRPSRASEPRASLGSSSMSAEALWEMALRPAKPLEAALLMADHPETTELPKRFFESGCTARAVVALTNAMYNPCRPANLRKRGLPVTPEQAWTTLYERRDQPHSGRPSKWRPLLAALDPMPADVEAQIRRMSILELGALAASLKKGPYALMETG